MGSATTLPAGALLGVQTTTVNAGIVNSTGGFMYPRVALAGQATLAPLVSSGGTAAEKLQHVGLTVYHIGGNNLDVGFYLWNGSEWLKVISEIPTTTSVIADLQTTVFAPLIQWNEPQNALTLNFGTLKVNEDGAYALQLRFYGDVYEDSSFKKLTSMASSSIYVWVFRSGSTIAVDAAELSFTLPPYGSAAGQRTSIAAFTVPNAKKEKPYQLK